MKSFTVLLTLSLLTTTASMARFEQADIDAEVEAYKQMQAQARDLLRPITDDKHQHVEQIAAPFRTQVEPLHQRVTALRQEQAPFCHEHDDLRRSLCGLDREMRDLQEKEVAEALKPLEEELMRKREPIQAELQRLAAREQEIYDNYHKWREQMKGAWDHIDEQDIGFRLGAIETKRKELLASVDSDLPERISQTRQTITDQYQARTDAKKREISEAMERLSAVIREKDTVIESIDRAIQTIWHAEREAVVNTIDSGIAEQLLPDLERRMIAGMRIG